MNKTGIKESELEGVQPKTHLSPVATSSDSEILTVFKRVERKRKPSPAPSPTPRKTRQKQQAVRPLAKKMTPKKRKQVIPTFDKLLEEITEDGKLTNISKLYKKLSNYEKEGIENSVILHLDIYKKFLMEIVDDIPNDLYKRLEARRVAIVELDKKIKIEKLLVVHLVNSK